MAVSEAKKRANRKFDAKTYTIVSCRIRKDYAELFKEACSRAGTCPNAVLRKAVDDFMNNSNNT